MIKVEDKERIRRLYYVDGKSIRQISRELGYARKTIRKALTSGEVSQYRLSKPRRSPVLGTYQKRIEELLAESERQPRKQRYTAQKIYELISADGYEGSQSGVGHYVAKLRKRRKRPKVYLPLEYDPGTDGQVDWGEAVVVMAGEQEKVQLFVMRLSYSRKQFVMAFPSQKQEAFFAGHVQAFHYFGGIPHRLSYDNLKTAVYKVLEGSKRQEQRQFTAFRSHYLFESHFCTPGAGHEKGGVEHGVGYGRRNFLSPLVEVSSYAELNAHLLRCCLTDDERQVSGQPVTIQAAWQAELPYLRPLPVRHFACCQTRTVSLNPYSQVTLETNRYSVPVEQAQKQLVAKLYPFEIKIYRTDQPALIATHARSYGRGEDVFDPLHYLSLLQQRPGAFEHAKPIRRWRETWPSIYETLLAHLRDTWPDGRGVREFIQVLQLHRTYPVEVMTKAIEQALTYHCAHADGVQLCARQVMNPPAEPTRLDLQDHPNLVGVGQQAIDLSCYDTLLGGAS